MSKQTYVFDYSRQANKFLERSQSVISREKVEEGIKLSIKKIKKIENNNSYVKPLKGTLKGLFRTRIGDIRIIFRFEGTAIIIVEIIEIGQRGGIYD